MPAFAQIAQLPATLVEMEFDLVVETNDWNTGRLIEAGFRYFFLREFFQQQPAVLGLYEIEYTILEELEGSRRFRARAKLVLRKGLSKVATAALVAALIALPAYAIIESPVLHCQNVVHAASQHIKIAFPYVTIEVDNFCGKQPEDPPQPQKQTFSKKGQSFDL